MVIDSSTLLAPILINMDAQTSSALTGVGVLIVLMDAVSFQLHGRVGDGRMKPGLGQNHEAAVPDKVGCYP